MSNQNEDVSFRIGRELYSRLRKHCDETGFRFIDFVEDALENALLTDTRIAELEQETNDLRRKAEQYEYAFNLGFRQGFSFLYLMLQGMSLTADAVEGLTIARKNPAVAHKGEQIMLF
jgi:hypothetical protein